MFKLFFLKRKLKRYIKRSSEILYSEKYDFSSDADQSLNRIINDITQNEVNEANSLLAYIAVSLTSKKKFPIDKFDINQSQNDYNSSIIELGYQNPQLHVLEIWRSKALINILKFYLDTEIGKIAYNNNKYSYQGMIYYMSKINKGPLPIKKQQEMLELTTELSKDQKSIKEIGKPN
ncbi:MAG: hypothetical protein ABSE72_04300 [Bacteroidales bacterium]|jgi:hypothetical protein